MNALLEIQGLGFSYGKKRILNNLSLSLTGGKLIAVLGPNGAGKSTFFRCVCGELTPESGTVTIAGRNLRDWTPLDLARIRAVLPQESKLAFNFSVFEVVMMGRTPHITRSESRHDQEIANLALEAVDLKDMAMRPYLTLSGGEKQRVHLARALAQIWEPIDGQPRFLFLDEPTNNLDLSHQHALLRLAQEWAHGRDVAVLAILHDLNLALAYADEAVVLHKGNVAAQGPVVDILTPEIVQSVFGVEAHRFDPPGELRPQLWFHVGKNGGR